MATTLSPVDQFRGIYNNFTGLSGAGVPPWAAAVLSTPGLGDAGRLGAELAFGESFASADFGRELTGTEYWQRVFFATSAITGAAAGGLGFAGRAAPYSAVGRLGRFNVAQPRVATIQFLGQGPKGGFSRNFLARTFRPGHRAALPGPYQRFLPQGLTRPQYGRISEMIRAELGDLADDVVVQGSRATGRARGLIFDIDFALLVNDKAFQQALIKSYVRADGRFPSVTVNAGRTVLHAVVRGRIFRGEAKSPRLRPLALRIEQQVPFQPFDPRKGKLKNPVDFSIVLRGGLFDSNPTLPLLFE